MISSILSFFNRNTFTCIARSSSPPIQSSAPEPNPSGRQGELMYPAHGPEPRSSQPPEDSVHDSTYASIDIQEELPALEMTKTSPPQREGDLTNSLHKALEHSSSQLKEEPNLQNSSRVEGEPTALETTTTPSQFTTKSPTSPHDESVPFPPALPLLAPTSQQTSSQTLPHPKALGKFSTNPFPGSTPSSPRQRRHLHVSFLHKSAPSSPRQLRKPYLHVPYPPSPRLERRSSPSSTHLPTGVVPPVPPETYLWEEVRRQRAQGGYPWSHLDKPPLGSKEDLNDHEYEVINPPPPRVDIDPPPGEKKPGEEDVAPAKRIDSETSSLGSGDPNFVHIPLHGDADVDPHDAGKDDLSAQELQARMEERFFAPTPETTESRTDCDVNTSQLDSSGLEDLPLRRGSRKKKAEDTEAQARGLQQRIRSQAGRLRAKLRSMKMPERPKFNLPERPKFNMPERPKFNLPERPKFNLPERPKFKLPERPKFNMPQRPKISMPSMPSFSRAEKPPKKSSSLRRPLRDRTTNPSTESNASSTKKNFFDFDFKTYPRIFDRSKRKGGDYATSSPKSTPRSQTPPPSMGSSKPDMPYRKKGPVGSRWVHRFTDIKYVDDEDYRADEEENARYRREESPEFRIVKLRDSPGAMKESDEELQQDKARYENQVRDAVEEMEKQRQDRGSVHTESTTAFRDKDYDYAVREVDDNTQKNERSIPESNREERSSGSSSERHRAGVLEEIDSDEFFLRQKGISQEDVDVGKYLTSEIREAFRPPTNALSQMDDKYFYDDEMEEEEEEGESLGNQYRGTPEREPIPPARTRSLKPRKRSNKAPPPADEEDSANDFNTFPPARPKRNRRAQQQEVPDSKDEEILEEEGDPTDGPTFLITEPQEMSYEEQPSEEGQRGYDEDPGRMEDEWQEMEEVVPPPQAPKRVRRSLAQKTSSREHVPEALRNGHYNHDEDWKENVSPNIMSQEVVALRMEHDYIVPRAPESPPIAPKRGRRQTSRGNSLHSLADTGRSSRGADSIRQDDICDEDMSAADRQDEPATEEPVQEEQAREQETTQQRSIDLDMGDNGGYATVEKVYPVKPVRPSRPKPPRPPAPARRKRFNKFFSLPKKPTHAPPTRPLRNYSTLGPSRPSRRDRSRKSEPYVEIEEDQSPSATEESHASNREDLKSGDVIERMKGRPLPAPPRPPRKSREAQEEGVDDDAEDVEPTIPQPDVDEHALGALNDAVFYSKKETITPELSTENQRIVEDSAVQSESQKTTPLDSLSRSETTEESQPTQVRETQAIQEKEIPRKSEPKEFEICEEVTVSTQTDPLPDDFCMEVEDEEPPPHMDACTETVDFGSDSRVPSLSEGARRTSESRVEETRLLAVETPVVEQRIEPAQAPVVQQPPQPALPPPPPTIIEREVPVYIMPDQDTVIELRAQRLQVADLDVERLNVGELQAQKILVSDIDGVSMQVAELSSKSGQLVINGIELPSGFLQELYDSFPRPEPVISQPPLPVPAPQPQVTPSEPVPQPPSIPEPPVVSTPAQPVTSVPLTTPPSIPPPPMHIPMDPIYSYIPSAMRVTRSQIQDMESDEELISFIPSAPRRRRHHAPKPVPRYSTDEEEESLSFHPRRHPQRSEPASIPELGRQLTQAVTSTSMRAVRSLIQYTTTQLEGEDKRRELQTVLCILLILVAGLILMGFGTGKTFHHHHWDYLNPPQ